jgi:hypothetical protein
VEEVTMTSGAVEAAARQEMVGMVDATIIEVAGMDVDLERAETGVAARSSSNYIFHRVSDLQIFTHTNALARINGSDCKRPIRRQLMKGTCYTPKIERD